MKGIKFLAVLFISIISFSQSYKTAVGFGWGGGLAVRYTLK